MLTKEYNTEKACVFYASDYHLEMILLPYIKEKIDNTKFIIFTENNLDKTLNILLEKINLKEIDKEKIKKINWKQNDKLKFKNLEELSKNQEDTNIIIKGRLEYIETINNNLKKYENNKLKIIDCFHVGDKNVNIKKISHSYKQNLNTQPF